MSNDNALTERQREALDAIVDFKEEHGIPPSQRELCDALGVSSTNAVRGLLEALEKKGAITRTEGKARAIRVR